MITFLWIIDSDIKMFSGNRYGNAEYFVKWNKPGIGRIRSRCHSYVESEKDDLVKVKNRTVVTREKGIRNTWITGTELQLDGRKKLWCA